MGWFLLIALGTLAFAIGALAALAIAFVNDREKRKNEC
jgi:predicted outer membrane lipoprotein